MEFLVEAAAAAPGESCCDCSDSSSAEFCPSWTVPFTATGPSPETPEMVKAAGNLPRGTDGLTVDEGAEDGEVVLVSSSRIMGIVDGPESDIGGISLSGDEFKMGEVIGIDGKLLDFVGESKSVNEVKESGDLLASSESEMLLGFVDDPEVEEGSGSVIASSAIGLKAGGVGSGDSEISIRIEGEPELVDREDLVLLKLPCREC